MKKVFILPALIIVAFCQGQETTFKVKKNEVHNNKPDNLNAYPVAFTQTNIDTEAVTVLSAIIQPVNFSLTVYRGGLAYTGNSAAIDTTHNPGVEGLLQLGPHVKVVACEFRCRVNGKTFTEAYTPGKTAQVPDKVWQSMRLANPGDRFLVTAITVNEKGKKHSIPDVEFVRQKMPGEK